MMMADPAHCAQHVVKSNETMISVALTTCNGCPFLAPQLESMAGQTRRPDEIVVGDDRSSDDTPRVVERFAAAHGIATHWHQNPTRLGHVLNFEQVVRRCRGDIVVFADHDDVWLPQKLARIEAALATDDVADAVFSNGSFMDERGNSLRGTLFGQLGFDAAERAVFRNGDALAVLLKRNVVTGATLAVRRPALLRLLPFEPNCGHDYYLALALSVLSRVLVLDEPLIRYRRHAGQQIGFTNFSWSALVTHIRRQGPRQSQLEAASFTRLRSRLIELGVDPDLPSLEALNAKARVMWRRAEMRSRRRRAPKLILQMLRDGSYRLHAAGWKQLALDLIALGVTHPGADGTPRSSR
jgi:glycosyltransferase involved in cell wall biosynthesis